MDLIADGLLFAGAITAAVYCWVLSNRVKKLSDLDSGLGSAIAALSVEVKEMQSALKNAQSITGTSVSELEQLIERSKSASDTLRLMLATVQESKTEKSTKKPTNVENFSAKKPKKPQDKESTSDTSPKPAVPALRQIKDPLPKGVEKTAPTTEVLKTEKLREEIGKKISERTSSTERDELVDALQSILATGR